MRQLKKRIDFLIANIAYIKRVVGERRRRTTGISPPERERVREIKRLNKLILKWKRGPQPVFTVNPGAHCDRPGPDLRDSYPQISILVKFRGFHIKPSCFWNLEYFYCTIFAGISTFKTVLLLIYLCEY